MAGKRKRKESSATGILRRDLNGFDPSTSKWIDPENVARGVGIDEDHVVKARLTLEVVEEPCELCGKRAFGDQICQKCGKVLCDGCARTVGNKRYCPACFVEVKKLSKLL